MEIKAVIYTGYIDALIGIETIEYGIDDIVKFRWYRNTSTRCGWDRLHRSKIKYENDGRSYFISYNTKWYLDDAIRTDAFNSFRF